MLTRLREFKWAAAVGASIVVFLFSTFSTVAQVNSIASDTRTYVNDKHSDVLDRLKEIQQTLNRLEERLYNRR